jgi:hypothetical protein
VKKKRKRKKNGGGESLVQIAQVSECPKGGKYELLGSFFSVFFFGWRKYVLAPLTTSILRFSPLNYQKL